MEKVWGEYARGFSSFTSKKRWYYQAFVINVLYKNYEKLLEVFDEVTAQPDGWDDESLDKVSGLLHFLNILYSVLQNTVTDFSYGISRIERFKNFVCSLHTDEDFDKFYQEAVIIIIII